MKWFAASFFLTCVSAGVVIVAIFVVFVYLAPLFCKAPVLFCERSVIPGIAPAIVIFTFFHILASSIASHKIRLVSGVLKSILYGIIVPIFLSITIIVLGDDFGNTALTIFLLAAWLLVFCLECWIKNFLFRNFFI
jgi:hypothetical protein